MKTIQQYRDDVANLMKKIGDIDAKVTNENRDPFEAEISLKNELMDAIEELHQTISAMERQERISTMLNTSTGTVTVPKQRVEVGDNRASKEKFASLGEQLAAVMKASMPGGHADPRLFNATGANETVPSEGGFMVQTDFTQELLKQVYQTGQLVSRCRKVTISGSANAMTINGVDETSRATGSRYGGIRGYWVDEAAEKTASKPTFRKIELKLKKLIGLCYATDELLDDVAALGGIIRDGFVSEFGFLLDDAVMNGTGAGQPLGILNAGCLVSQAAETGQVAATVVAENVIKMYSRLFASSRANSVWFINQNVEPQLHTMSIAVGTGGYPLYMPPGGLMASPYGMLLGRPVIPIEQCQSLGTVGDIVLADLTSGYILAEKGGVKSDMSIHVKFVYDESVFRFVLRVDGQPVRATPLTPYKGGANFTQSHFVALATRS